MRREKLCGEGEFAGEVVVPTDGEDGVVGEGEGYDGKEFEREEGRQSGEVGEFKYTGAWGRTLAGLGLRLARRLGRLRGGLVWVLALVTAPEKEGATGVVAHQERQHPFQKWEEGRKGLGSNPGIGGIVRGHAVQHKGKPFKCFEKHLEILKGCFPLATPCQALGSQQVFLLMTDQA